MGTQVYAAQTRRSSLLWLALSLFLGGGPLVVYFTQPGAPAANAVLAVMLGVPCFAMSIRELVVRRAIVVDRDGGRLLYGEGFLRLRVRDVRFDDVALVEVRGDEGPVVSIRLRRGPAVEIERDDAHRVACEIARVVGVPYRGAETSFEDSSSTNAPMRRYLS
jgi:hypothetical protein